MPSGLALALFVAMTAARPAAVQLAPTNVQDLYARQKLPAYFEIVTTYRAGRIDRATTTILAWPEAEVDQAIKALARLRGKIRPCPTLPDEIAAADLDAAVLLHTDASTEAYVDDDWNAFTSQLEFARRLVEIRRAISAMWETAGETPHSDCQASLPLTARDWYLAMATSLQGVWELPTADRLARFGLEVAPGDPAMLLAAGSIREAIAHGAAQDPGLPPSDQLSGSAFRREHNRRLSELRTVEIDRRGAATLFERALATGAAPLEARLRLGRVLSQIDRRADGRRALGEVLAAEPTAGERYLARLFLGRVADLEDDAAGAAEEYRRAVEVQPRSQAARIALAHALDRAGDPGGRAPLAGVLAEPWPRDGWDDPWWTYYFGQFREGRRLLDELRRRVMTE